MIQPRYNRFWIGLSLGILSPILVLVMYWLFFYAYMSFPVRFITYLLNGNMLANVIKVCVLGNLAWFYWSMKKTWDAASKGVLTSVFLYLLLVLWISYYLETDLS